jgi:hypothetical protein
MNRKIFLLLLLFSPGFYLFAQQQAMNEIRFDTAAKQQILIGLCNREGLNSEIFGQYFRDEYDHYSEDPQAGELIGQNIKGADITIVMATWCDDSRQQVGRFYKVLDNAGYPADKVTLVCVDKKKKGGPVSLEGMDIQKVPTFIVYRHGREEGRIIETPEKSLEQDLLMIIQK